MNMIWIDLTDIHNFFNFRNDEISSRSNGTIKILLCHAILEITGGIGFPGSYECYVPSDPFDEYLFYTIDDFCFFILCY